MTDYIYGIATGCVEGLLVMFTIKYLFQYLRNFLFYE